jgi:probable phosphoglycerate mutase
MPLSSARDFEIPNAALNWVEIGAEHWRVHAWAERAHLEETLDELRERPHMPPI